MTVNKNAIPNDPQKPTVTSGIRIGSPAMTTRGFGAAEAETARQPDRRRARSDRRASSTLQRVTREVEGAVREVSGVRLAGRRSNAPSHALPVLLERRHPGGRLALERGRQRHPAAPQVPEMRQALHHLRAGRAAHAAAGEEGRQPHRLRPRTSCAGCMRALRKRPVATEDVDAAIDRIEEKLRALGEREIPTSRVGDLVMRELQKLDESPTSALPRCTQTSSASTISATPSRKSSARAQSAAQAEPQSPAAPLAFSARRSRHMARALRLAGKGPVHHHAQSARRLRASAQGETVVGEGWHEKAGGPHAEVVALRAGRRARARRDRLRDARTLQPPRAHAALRRCADRRRQSRAWSRRCTIPNPQAAQRRREAARRRHRRRARADGGRGARTQHRLRLAHDARPALGAHEDRRHARRPHRARQRPQPVDHRPRGAPRRPSLARARLRRCSPASAPSRTTTRA